MKKVCVVTGYRSDYTKLKSAIKFIDKHPDLDLQLLVFGAHLSEDHGKSIKDIEADGYPITYRCTTNVDCDNPLSMSKTIGLSIIDLASAYGQLSPDIVVLVGDRYEILAAAMAASISNIPVAHIQGGEISGTIDEVIRHTITKLSHVHFPSTELSKKRILMMGENPEHVFNVGCPAIDHINSIAFVGLEKIKKMPGLSRLRIDINNPYFILAQHPVTTEYEKSEYHMTITLESLQEIGIQTVLMYPNPDSGSKDIVRAIRKHNRRFGDKSVVRTMYKNIAFDSYLNLLKYSSCLIGNSSSGIREAHVFSTPVINIGSRQSGRERTKNIIDVGNNKEEISSALKKFINPQYGPHSRSAIPDAPYGTGNAGESIASILSQIKLENITQKSYNCLS